MQFINRKMDRYDKMGGDFDMHAGGFSELIGNEQIKEHFLHAISSGKVSHCYVISGEDGLGKMTAAKAFAQTLECQAEPANRPCGVCHSCTQFLSGNHPDVIFPGHEKPTVIGVDDVRTQIIGDIQIKPYCSPYKIYIVDEAQKLSVQAQNALLKTIEEPPAYGIILLLTTNAASMLETILSRSIVLNMKPVESEAFTSYMREKVVDEDKIPTLEKFSQGNIGKGLKLAQSDDFISMIQTIMLLLKTASKMPFSELLESIAKLEEYKLSIKDCFGFMQMWYRDILIFKATRDPNLLIFAEEYSAINKVAQTCGYNEINRILEAINTASARLDANVNFQLTLELLWLTIRECQK